MKKYKVRFENNRALSAELFNPEAYDDEEFVSVIAIEGRSYIDWLTVYAESEQDAFEIAETVVDQYFLNTFGKSSD